MKSELERIDMNLRMARLIKGLTQHELGFRVGLSNRRISEIETGKRFLRRAERIKIERALKVRLPDAP